MGDDILRQSKSPDIRNSLAAMRRAARRAREIGRISGTGIVMQESGRIVRVLPEQLEVLDLDKDENKHNA